MIVGQTVIAVGRTFTVQQVNVSVGILSAKGRIWDKAVQTDAKISPTNYGGPLIDLHGNVLPPPGLYGRILREMEMPLIEIALDATGGNQAKCADLLGINRNTLRKKITDLDIQVTRRRKLM